VQTSAKANLNQK